MNDQGVHLQILHRSNRERGAYTLVDTLTYALILIIAVFLIYRWMQRTGLSFDRRLLFATLPWVVFGGLARVVEDTGMLPAPWRYLLITPLIFFVLFFYAVAVLYLCHRFLGERGVRVYAMVGPGLGRDRSRAAPLVRCHRSHARLHGPGGDPEPRGGDYRRPLGPAPVRLSLEYVSDRVYQVLIAGHMLDASATSYGIDLHPLGYVEQHVVGSALIAATGTGFAMFPLSFLVLIPGIYILELYRREGSATSFWHLIVLAMIVVGLAPGIRDMMRMMLYV